MTKQRDWSPDWSVHPGEILLETLNERNMTQATLAKHAGTTPPVISHIVHGSRGIGPVMALKLEDALGISARFWMHLQADHDLYCARQRMKAKL